MLMTKPIESELCGIQSEANENSGGSSGPSSPTPSISCETCSQLSQLEIEAFAAVREVAPFVRSICVSEILSRTPELLFLNLVTLENESYCIELTQKGWRICSDRLDCMYGDFRKLDMHVAYYDTIYALLDSLSKMYRESFGQALSQRLDVLQHEQQEEGEQMDNSLAPESTELAARLRSRGSVESRGHSPERCGNPIRRRIPCDECPATTYPRSDLPTPPRQ